MSLKAIRKKRKTGQNHANSTSFFASKADGRILAALNESRTSQKSCFNWFYAELLWLRHAVLHTAGFDVLTTENEADALASIRKGECGVLLVCYSLSLGVRRRLAEAFRSHCPYGKIVAITNTQLEKPDFADSYVYGVEGPEVLIQSL